MWSGFRFTELKAFGQHAPCAWVMRPNDNGWQKRPSIAFAPNKSKHEEDANADLSTGLWQGLHDHMFQGPYKTPAYLHYDEIALGLYRTISRAAEDWLDKKQDQRIAVDRFFQVKIRFKFSDIRRFCNFSMRSAQ